MMKKNNLSYPNLIVYVLGVYISAFFITFLQVMNFIILILFVGLITIILTMALYMYFGYQISSHVAEEMPELYEEKASHNVVLGVNLLPIRLTKDAELLKGLNKKQKDFLEKYRESYFALIYSYSFFMLLIICHFFLA